MTEYDHDFEADTSIPSEETLAEAGSEKDEKNEEVADATSDVDEAQAEEAGTKETGISSNEVELSMSGNLSDLVAHADRVISEGYVRKVHLCSENGTACMTMEYDEAVAIFVSELASDPTCPDRKLEFTLSAR